MVKGFRSGLATIVGRPNVGKSTLLNRVVGQKLSITSSKPQTTRWTVTGVRHGPDFQVVFVDTPGLQHRYQDQLNRHMNREVINALQDVDVILFMVEALVWNSMDIQALTLLQDTDSPVLLLINKIDRLADRDRLLPFIEEISLKRNFTAVIPLSVKRNKNVRNVEETVISLLPAAPPLYNDDQISDRSERFFAAEFVREKLTRRLGRELPYRLTVTVEQFVRKENSLHISVVIWVEGESQKRIIIGKEGRILKATGEQARKDMERLFDSRIYLETWVKVRKNWTTDMTAMRQFGYDR